MEPLEVLAALAPIATGRDDAARPPRHKRRLPTRSFPGVLPKDASAAGVAALFPRASARAASAFDKNGGMLEGADRFLRATARTAAKVAGHTSGAELAYGRDARRRRRARAHRG